MNQSNNPFSTDFETWCLIQGLNEKTIKILQQEDLVTPDVLEMLSTENIKELSLSMGQRKYLEKAISSLQGNSFTESISSSLEIDSSPVLFSDTCRTKHISQNESQAKSQIDAVSSSTNFDREFFCNAEKKSANDNDNDNIRNNKDNSDNINDNKDNNVNNNNNNNHNDNDYSDNDYNNDDNNNGNNSNDFSKYVEADNNFGTDFSVTTLGKDDVKPIISIESGLKPPASSILKTENNAFFIDESTTCTQNNTVSSTLTEELDDFFFDDEFDEFSTHLNLVSPKKRVRLSEGDTRNHLASPSKRNKNDAENTLDNNSISSNNFCNDSVHTAGNIILDKRPSTSRVNACNVSIRDMTLENVPSTSRNILKKSISSSGNMINNIPSTSRKSSRNEVICTSDDVFDSIPSTSKYTSYNGSARTSGKMIFNDVPSTSRNTYCKEGNRVSANATPDNIPSTSRNSSCNGSARTSGKIILNDSPSTSNFFSEDSRSSGNIIDNIPSTSRNSSCNESIFEPNGTSSGKMSFSDAPSTNTNNFCNEGTRASANATPDNIPSTCRNSSCNESACTSGKIILNDSTSTSNFCSEDTRSSGSIIDNISVTSRNSSCDENILEPNDTGSSSFLEDHDEVDDYIMQTQLQDEEFEQQRLQEHCDLFLDQTDQDHNIRYQVVLYGKQWCFICGYCKEKGPLVLGSGLGTFRQHLQSLAHMNKRRIHQGLRRLEETTRDQVFGKMDQRIFQLSKKGKIICKLCKTSFENVMSGKSLEKKIQLHVDSKEHKMKMRSVSKTKTVDSFFQRK